MNSKKDFLWFPVGLLAGLLLPALGTATAIVLGISAAQPGPDSFNPGPAPRWAEVDYELYKAVNPPAGYITNPAWIKVHREHPEVNQSNSMWMLDPAVPIINTNVFAPIPANTSDLVAGAPLELAKMSTNRYTNILSVIQVIPINTPCPECGANNHHEQHVEHVQIFEMVTATLVVNGQTNNAMVYRSPGQNSVRTNTVFKPWSSMRRTQPGNWTNPPSPINLTGAPPQP